MARREGGVFQFFSHGQSEGFADLHVMDKIGVLSGACRIVLSQRTLASVSGEVFMNRHRPVSGTCSRLGESSLRVGAMELKHTVLHSRFLHPRLVLLQASLLGPNIESPKDYVA